MIVGRSIQQKKFITFLQRIKVEFFILTIWVHVEALGKAIFKQLLEDSCPMLRPGITLGKRPTIFWLSPQNPLRIRHHRIEIWIN